MTELKKIGSELDGHGVMVRVNPEIARALKEEEPALLRDLQQSLGKPVTIKPDVHLHHEQFDVMATIDAAPAAARRSPLAEGRTRGAKLRVSVYMHAPALRQVDQVVIATLVEPHTDVVVALERLDLRRAGRGRRVLDDDLHFRLRNDADDLAALDAAALHELDPALQLWVTPTAAGTAS